MKRILFILCHVFVFQAFSQNAPMSPQVSSAEGLFSNNLYTGAPNVNIPFPAFTSRDITVPITLVYTGGNGIRVNEEASWVGLGWHLQVGGFVAQQIRGIDDFNPAGYIASNKLLPCFEGDRTWPINPEDQKDCLGNTTSFMAAPLSTDIDDYDLEPDIFVLSMPGLNTKFFYDKNPQGRKVFTSSSTDIIITPLEPLGSGFVVEASNGLRYTFNVKELAVEQAAISTKNYNQGTTWYLAKIYSNISEETVFFNYDTQSSKLKQNFYSKTLYQSTNPGVTALLNGSFQQIPGDYVEREYGEPDGMGGYNNTCCKCSIDASTFVKLKPSEFCNSSLQWYNKTEVHQIERNQVYLNNISSSLGKVYFITDLRADVGDNASKKLTSISYKMFESKSPREILVASYNFAYDYFNSSANSGNKFSYPYPGYDGKRLKLLSVQQSPSDNSTVLPGTKFNYNEGGLLDLPYKTSFDIDYWGYYNFAGQANHNTDLVKYPNDNSNYVYRSGVGLAASSNLLKKVQYSTGAFTEFTYQTCKVGVRVETISSYEDINNQMTKKYVYEEGPNYTFPAQPITTIKISSAWQYTSCYFNAIYYGTPTMMQYFSTIDCSYNLYLSNSPFSFSDLSSISPTNHIKVTELNGLNGEFGKIEYSFSKIKYTSPKFPFVPINKNPLEGLLTKKVVYKNVAGTVKIQSEETYVYNFNSTFPNVPDTESEDGNVVYTRTSSNGIKTFNNGKIVFSGYVMKIAQLNSVKTISTVYDQNSTNSIVQTSWKRYNIYGNVNEIVENNNPVSGTGSYTRIYNYYERDNSASYLFKHKPVEVTSYTFTGDVNASPLVKAYNNSFTQYSYKALPQSIWTSNILVVPSTGVIPTDKSYRKVSSLYYVYDNLFSKDVLLQENVAGGFNKKFTTTSFLYGYRKSHPVAIINNAELSQIAYMGFDNDVEGYQIQTWENGSGSSLVDKETEPDNVFMGRYSTKLDPKKFYPAKSNQYITNQELPQKGKYKFSCWIKLGAVMLTDKVKVQINSGSHIVEYSGGVNWEPYPNIPEALRVSYPDKNNLNWQYVEVILDLDRLVQVVNPNGNGQKLPIAVVVINEDVNIPVYVDEMRLHPVDAQMTTYTYKPGIGKTSEAGPDSKPVHYEYDGYNRLKYIRDFRNNILKKNQYFIGQ